MAKFPINAETQITAFEAQTKKPVNDQLKTFLTLMTKLENQAYEQGKADALKGKPGDVVRLPVPFNCIKRVILSDGTVYDNVIYETEAPILTGEQMSAAAGFDHKKWWTDYAARLDAQEKNTTYQEGRRAGEGARG